ncbi:MAG: AAA family ATPase [Planctomycetaceae bacterium]|nr:AAA family ATPase [Planctomycetaceae bacterium]
MKILRISLRNIASLAGLHTVDFTCDPLAKAGLYSISGPTGAGKSSLLDALCLALYEKTPRLNRVGRLEHLDNGEKQDDPRTLLRRGTAEGMAEVAFVGIDNQQWTARWSVRRAHNKPDGNLQQSEMTLFKGHISPGGQGPVECSGKKTEVNSAIQSKIGLTFDQFTRAVLLAQNDFATFLKADDKERAEILQALTGTEQFEAISKAVFERTKKEKAELDRVRERIRDHQPMDDEQREAAQRVYAAAKEQHAELDQQHRQLQTQLDWFKEHHARDQQVQTAKKGKQIAEQKLHESTQRRIDLSLTQRVQRECRMLRANQLAAKEQIQVAENSHSKAAQRHSYLVKALEEYGRKFDETSRNHDRLLQQQTDLRASLLEARKLDSLLQPAKRRKLSAEEQFTEAETQHAAAQQKLTQANQIVENLQARIASLIQQQSSLSAYAPFAPEMSLWLIRLDQARVAREALYQSEQQLRQLQQSLEQLQRDQQAAKDSEAPLREKCQQTELDLVAAKEAEAAFDPDQLADHRRRLMQTQSVLNEYRRYWEDQQRLQGERNRLTTEIQLLEKQNQAEEAQRLRFARVDLPQTEMILEKERRSIERMRAAVDDAAKRLRSTLQNNEPCPVCGSHEHPFSTHEPDVESSAIRAAEEVVSETEKRLRNYRASCSKLEASIEQRSGRLKEYHDQIRSTTEMLQALTFEHLAHDAVVPLLQVEASDRGPTIQRQLATITDQIRAVETQDVELRKAVRHSQHCAKQFAEAEKSVSNLRQQFATLEKQCEVARTRVESQLSAVQDNRRVAENSRLSLQPLLDVADEGHTAFETDARSLRISIHQRLEDCLQTKEQLQIAEKEHVTARSSVSLQRQSCESTEAVLQKCRTEQALATAEVEQLTKQRQQLLEGRDADVVEADISNRIQSMAQELEQLRQKKNAAQSEEVAARAELNSRAEQLQTAEQTLEKAEEQLQSWLTAFAAQENRLLSMSEIDIMLSRSSEWIQSEQQSLESIQDMFRSADAGLQAAIRQLNEHSQTRPSQESEQQLRSVADDLRKQVEAAIDQMASARSILDQDDKLRERCESLHQELRQLEMRVDPWLRLDEFIGSADGAKFRKMAQRRTLEILIGYANAHLEQLTSRYRLQSLGASLNLVVADRDMGDQLRSILSLSGGESFLVSLALALGLASLTSNRLRIESLFIDEGFGSLDQETLAMAMNALMHLESQGRKVGVISHVTEMTDAIPVQIRVVKGRHGASRIVVPGFTEAATVRATDTSGRAFVVRTLFDNTPEGIEEHAARIVQILEQNQASGKTRTSLKSLRADLGCDHRTFRYAQSLLGSKVAVEGRSLKLNSASSADPETVESIRD